LKIKKLEGKECIIFWWRRTLSWWTLVKRRFAIDPRDRRGWKTGNNVTWRARDRMVWRRPVEEEGRNKRSNKGQMGKEIANQGAERLYRNGPANSKRGGTALEGDALSIKLSQDRSWVEKVMVPCHRLDNTTPHTREKNQVRVNFMGKKTKSSRERIAGIY